MFVAIVRAEACPELLRYLSTIIYPVEFVRVASLSRFRFPEPTHIPVSLLFQAAIYTPDRPPAYLPVPPFLFVRTRG